MLIVHSSVDVDDPDLPLIGYDQILTTSNVSASSEASDYPITRVTNPATHLFWKGSSAAITYITFTTDGVTPIEYIAIVGHNFDTAGIQPSIEYLDYGVSPPAWTTLQAAQAVTGGEPIVWWVGFQTYSSLRIKMSAGSAAPEVAVAQAGELLIMPNKIYSRHVPVPYGFKTNIANGFSESGLFLGRIVLGETRQSSAQFRFIQPTWFRSNIPAFLEAAQERPFLFIWRPDTYPDEIGYCVLSSDISPAPEDPSANNLIAFEIQMEGLA